MNDDELARLENENMAAWLRISCGQVAGSLVVESGGVSAFGSGLPLALFNQVVVTGDDPTEAGMAASIQTLQARGAPFYLVLRRAIDERFAGVAGELGLALEDDILPGMALAPIPPADDPPAGHGIRLVDDAAGLDDHVAVDAAAFGIPEPLVRPWIGERLWEIPGCAVYVGYTDGQPVSSGFSVRTADTIGIYTIATIESARRRGYGAAMTARVAADGAAAGCRVAVLQPSEMGKPVYERLGFRTVSERIVYRG